MPAKNYLRRRIQLRRPWRSPDQPSSSSLAPFARPPSLWDAVVDRLHNAGYDTLAVELQSVSPPSTAPAKTVADDAAHIHGIVEALARDDKEVLVVMSSHGGIPGTQAVKNLTKKNDRSKAREEKE